MGHIKNRNTRLTLASEAEPPSYLLPETRGRSSAPIVAGPPSLGVSPRKITTTLVLEYLTGMVTPIKAERTSKPLSTHEELCSKPITYLLWGPLG